MKGKIRNIFPGGNTPKGFYSYYNHILPQRKAENIFCIKGGPGVGKSTLMKAVGQRFAEKGEDVDYLWCSSDPDSLDGVLLKKRNTVLLDGTAPHVIDPKTPGAVDEIVNLGAFWNEEGIRKNREEIIDYNERISETFAYAYGYLRCAEAHDASITQLLNKLISPEKIWELKKQAELWMESIPAVKRAESRAVRALALGKHVKQGTLKKGFATAITPAGLKNEVNSIITGVERLLVLETPECFPTEKILLPLAERLTDAGFDVEAYYCPMAPDSRVEHIFCLEAGLAAVTDNRYHNISAGQSDRKLTRLTAANEEKEMSAHIKLLEELQQERNRSISRALGLLSEAKQLHDVLEGYYVPHMNFEEIRRVKNEIIGKIEDIIVQ